MHEIQIISKLQFDALVSQLFQKQDEIMDLSLIMNMHVTICHENNLKFIDTTMHAWIKL